MEDSARWSASMPAIYDRCLGPVLFAPFAKHVAQRVAPWAPARVLEVAAGSGIVTAELVRALPEAEVVATDLNEAMVEVGRERATQASWQVADAQQLPFPDHWADVVVCQFGIMFVPDKPRAYAEMARVLRPGGHALVLGWDEAATSDFPAALAGALEDVFGADRPDFVERVPHGYADPARIRADAQAGGLRVHSLERVVLAGHAESAAQVATGFCRGTPLTFELAARGDLDELTEQVTARMTERLGSGPVRGDLAAYVLDAGT